MGLFRLWLVILGMGSLGAVMYGLSMVGHYQRGPMGGAMIVGGVAGAFWFFGFNSVVGAIQRIEAKLGTAPEKAAPKTQGSASSSPP